MKSTRTLKKALAILMVLTMGIILTVGAVSESEGGVDLSAYTKRIVHGRTVYVDVNGNTFILDASGNLVPYIIPGAGPTRAPGGATPAARPQQSAPDGEQTAPDGGQSQEVPPSDMGGGAGQTSGDSAPPAGQADGGAPGQNVSGGEQSAESAPDGGGAVAGQTGNAETTGDSGFADSNGSAVDAGSAGNNSSMDGDGPTGGGDPGADQGLSYRDRRQEPTDGNGGNAPENNSDQEANADGLTGDGNPANELKWLDVDGLSGGIELTSGGGESGEPGGDGGESGEPGGDGGESGEPGGDGGESGEPGGDDGESGEPGGDDGESGEPGGDDGESGEPGGDGGESGEPGGDDGESASAPALTLTVIIVGETTAAPGNPVTVKVSATTPEGGEAPTGTISFACDALDGLGDSLSLAEGSAEATGTVKEDAANGTHTVVATYGGEDYAGTEAGSCVFIVSGGTDAPEMAAEMEMASMALGASERPPLPMTVESDTAKPLAGDTIQLTVSTVGGIVPAVGSMVSIKANGNYPIISIPVSQTFGSEGTIVFRVTFPSFVGTEVFEFTFSYVTHDLGEYGPNVISLKMIVGEDSNVIGGENTQVIFSPASPQVWSGTNATTTVQVVHNGKVLTGGTDYMVSVSPSPSGSVSGNTVTMDSVGAFDITVEGISPDYSGNVTRTYIVTRDVPPQTSFTATRNTDGTVILRFTAWRNMAGPVPTGTVTFTGPNGYTKDVLLDANGYALIAVPSSFVHAGQPLSFTAVYSGDSYYKSVTRYASVAGGYANPNWANAGLSLSAKMQSNNRSATLTAAISPQWWCYGPGGWYWSANPYAYPDGSGYSHAARNWYGGSGWGHSPTGWVSFYAGDTLLDTVRMVDGEATMTWRSVPTGTHRITAVYSGDNHFKGSRATATLTRRSSSGSSSSAVGALQTGAGAVKLRDAGGNILESYDIGSMTPVDGVLTIQTAQALDYYSFGFPLSEFSQRAGQSGQFTLSAPGVTLAVPYDFVAGIVGLSEYIAGNNLSTGQMELRISLRRLEASAVSLADNSPAVTGDCFRIDVTLHRADGTVCDFAPGEFGAPMQLIFPGWAQANTALFYDETSRAMLPVGVSTGDGAAAVTVEWNGIYTVAQEAVPQG